MMYEELIKRLKDYSTARKGEIAELTEKAADAIEKLVLELDKASFSDGKTNKEETE